MSHPSSAAAPRTPGAGHEAVLRGVGLRVTRPRLAVLDALERHPHARTDEVIADVRATVGASTQAVYDVLAVLGEHALVRRVQPAGSPARYELRTGDDHHHVVCRGCGEVGDVDRTLGAATCLGPADLGVVAPGFHLERTEVTFWGTCGRCRDAAPLPGPRPDSHQFSPTDDDEGARP